MHLKITVRGTHGAQATAKLFLDYSRQTGVIVASMGWSKTRMGTIWRLGWSTGNEILFLSNDETTRLGDGHGMTLQNCPVSETDSTHTCGTGKMRNALSPEFSTAKITWEVAGISALRKEILGIISRLGLTMNPADKDNYPNGPPSEALKKKTAEEYEKNNPGKKAPVYKGTVSNCGEFPGNILSQVGGELPVEVTRGVMVKNTVKLKATNNMTHWKEFGEAVDDSRKTPGVVWRSWSKDSGIPKPGDIYVLRSKPDGIEFKHVGIIVESQNPIWKTADAGQGASKFGACYRHRVFDRTTSSVTLQTDSGAPIQPDSGARYLWGWVDVDALFQRKDD